MSDNKNIIVNFTKLNIRFKHKINYSLIGIISSPSSIHFTGLIVNFEGNIQDYNKKPGSNYFHY